MARTPFDLGHLKPLIGYHLRRASAAFLGDFSAVMQDTGIRQVPLAVLAMVAANPHINQGTIGVALGIKRANMVALINELVGRGLIEREVAPGDRRAFALTLTPAGEAMLTDAMARIERHEARMLANLSPDEQRQLRELLVRIEPGEDLSRPA